MKLNLRQIEVFRAIMLSGSISGASKLLFVSQPAISRLLAYTEQRLGLLLFKRVKGRLYPTPEAHRLFEEVGELYLRVQRVNEVAENLAENKLGHLRIACSPSLGLALLPQAVAAFCARFPAVRVALYTLVPKGITQALLTRKVELGVAYLPNPHPSLEAHHIYPNRIVAVLDQRHPLAARTSISPTDLIGEPLIGYGSDIPLGQIFRQLFGRDDAEPALRIEVQQAHVACAMVEAGAGIAVVDEMTAGINAWSNLRAVPIEPEVNAAVKVFTLEIEPLSLLAQEFMITLKALDLVKNGTPHPRRRDLDMANDAMVKP